MGILAILIAGIIAGMLAGFIMGRTGFGILGDLIVGLIGSFIGGFFFGNHLSITSSVFANVLITATAGAVILLFVIRMFGRPYSRHSQTT